MAGEPSRPMSNSTTPVTALIMAAEWTVFSTSLGARTVKTRHQQVGKRQRQTDQKDLLGQRAFRQRIRLRTHTLFPFILYIPKPCPRTPGHSLFYKALRYFCKMETAKWRKKNTAPGGASCFLRKISQPRSSPLVAMTCLYQSKLFFL